LFAFCEPGVSRATFVAADKEARGSGHGKSELHPLCICYFSSVHTPAGKAGAAWANEQIRWKYAPSRGSCPARNRMDCVMPDVVTAARQG
jgi:hypothetical protein